MQHARSGRINLLKDRTLERPIIAQGGAVHFVGVGPIGEEATEDAARRAVDFTVARTDLDREERRTAVGPSTSAGQRLE